MVHSPSTDGSLELYWKLETRAGTTPIKDVTKITYRPSLITQLQNIILFTPDYLPGPGPMVSSGLGMPVNAGMWKKSRRFGIFVTENRICFQASINRFS
jgi:hypothetical protein